MSSEEILRLVRQLPPATQAVFNLYVMEGFNHKEIGQLLGISDGTSKWHLSEARRILQQLINNEEKGS
jgi:RNA polymerase sigma-70 factor (ECF subfamily)